MRHTLKFLFVAVMVTVVIVWPISSHADGYPPHGDDHGASHGSSSVGSHSSAGHDSGNRHGHDHGYAAVDINFNVWPGSYYDNAPYYPPDDGVLISDPVYQPVVEQVQPSVVVTQPAAAVNTDTEDSYTVNIPNDKGGYTAVLLKRSGTGFVGPQGEFYPAFPKVRQLILMYGRTS